MEPFPEKVIPKSVKLVFVPMPTFLIMGTLGLAVLGPLGTVFGNYLAIFFTFLSTNASWAPSVLIGGLMSLIVMFGLHNGVAPLGVMQMAERGYDSILGSSCVCSNIAQGIVCLVITEPALYSVNLPKKCPLISAMFGGGCGGLYEV